MMVKIMMKYWYIIVPSSSLSSSNRDGGEAILEQNGKGEFQKLNGKEKGEIEKQMSKKRTKYSYKHL